jgi:hypothetical protein
MKFALTIMMILGSSIAASSDVKDFSKALNDDVRKDIETDNDQTLKTDNVLMRKPASVEAIETDIKEEDKIEKNFKQIGGRNW